MELRFNTTVFDTEDKIQAFLDQYKADNNLGDPERTDGDGEVIFSWPVPEVQPCTCHSEQSPED